MSVEHDRAARVIGWHPTGFHQWVISSRPFRCTWCYKTRREAPPRCAHDPASRMTADDMLAWLHQGTDETQRGIDNIEPTGHGWRVTTYDPTYRDTADHEAATLFDALALAVVAIGESEAHAPDQPQAAAISYRSTGRGAYDVIEARAEGPDVVLAQVLFTEGVRGWRGAMERFTAHLATVSQDGTS